MTQELFQTLSFLAVVTMVPVQNIRMRESLMAAGVHHLTRGALSNFCSIFRKNTTSQEFLLCLIKIEQSIAASIPWNTVVKEEEDTPIVERYS